MSTSGAASSRLPVRGGLSLLTASSLAIALVMLFASVVGLANQRVLYASNALRVAFTPSDWFSLLIALPVLLASVWLASRGQLIGLLCWPAVLFYSLYVYLPYVIAVPFNVLFLPHLVVVVLSAYTLIGLMAAIEGEAVRTRLGSGLPLRAAAVILFGLGILVAARQSLLIVGAIAGQQSVGILERSTFIADFAIVPLLLAGGVLLWLRRPLGLVAAPGLLLGYGLLALGLIPFFLVQSRITGQPIDSAGIATVLVMAGLCLVPFALFVRAARERPSA